MSLRAHVKALGIIYIALGTGVLLFAALGAIFDAIEGTFAESAGVVAILVGLAITWLHAGHGLLQRRPFARVFAIMVAAVPMIGLNSLLLLTGEAPFSTSPAWIAFHVSCIAVGIYTLVVMFRPGILEAFG